MTSTITTAHAQAFEEHGYFVVEPALDAGTLALLQREADLGIEQEEESLRRGGQQFVPVSVLGDRYVISGRSEKSGELRRFLLGELMADICRAAIGPDAFLFSETFVCKMPRNQRGWIWHQDSSYLAHAGMGHYPPNLSVWVALDRMTEENGTLRLIPWSTSGIREVVPHDFSKPWDSDEVVSFGQHEEVTLPVEAGSIVVMSGVIPHASSPNRTGKVRRACLVQYSSVRIEKDGRPHQLAVPLLRGGLHCAE
jgi:ectoine hydroxylase-related dioxygenase (phytanoyl-CoA dioxygenase family)